MIARRLKLICIILIAACAPLLAQRQAMLGRSDTGEIQWVISQNYSPFSGKFNQQLWWLKADPINSQGQLLGSWWDGSQLVLIYPKSAFLSHQLDRQLIIKAPRNQQLIALGANVGNGQWHTLLKDKITGRFLRRNAELEPTELTVLKDHEDKAFSPWSSPRYPALWFPSQDGLGSHELCLFNPDFSQCRLLDLDLKPDEEMIAFSEDADGLWLLPKSGVFAWKWNGSELTTTELPAPKEGQHWLSISPNKASWAGIQDGTEGLQLWLDNERIEMPLKKSSPKPTDPERPLWLQWVFFAIMVSSFIAILNWRREGRVQAQSQKTDTKKNSQTASVTVRSLAFLLDMFILNIPLTLISQGLSLPEVSVEQLEGLALGKTILDENLIVNLTTILFYKLVLLLGLSFSYHLLLERKMGASLGKLFFHIQVKTTTGESPKTKALLIRGTVRSLDLVLPIPPSLLFALFNSQKLSLADRISNTRVLRLS